MGRTRRAQTLLIAALTAAASVAAIAPPAASVAAMCFGLGPTISGSARHDLIVGTPGTDVIWGDEGDDVIDGRGGNDVICGGPGDDQIQGGKGVDFLVAGTGADTVRGGQGADWLFDVDPTALPPTTPPAPPPTADSDSDALLGGPGGDLLSGEGGNDILEGGGGSDYVHGLTVSESLVIDLARGTMTSASGGLDALSGIENVLGGFGSDVIVGDEGDNLLGGFSGSDRISGGDGSDILFSYIDGSTLEGGDDDATDTLWVSMLEPARADLTSGTVLSLQDPSRPPDAVVGFETLIGTAYDDVLIGDDGDNRIGGVGGADRIEGRAGDDVLLGDAPDYIRSFYEEGRDGGRDFIDGGDGRDEADGGPKRDGCVSVEKARSCEGDTAPAPAGCPETDPTCGSPVLPSEVTGILQALWTTSRGAIDGDDLAWIASMLARIPGFEPLSSPRDPGEQRFWEPHLALPRSFEPVGPPR